MGIRAANKAYERWLAHELRGDLVEGDVDKKHEKMRDSAFAFLRATYWRWAETILEVCPDLAKAPAVLAVGDIHLENFGTWRDAEGRLIWGVNDYDEAAEMPYLLDLVGWRRARCWRRANSRSRSRRFARISCKATRTAWKRRKPSCSTASTCGCARASWWVKPNAPCSGRRSRTSITTCWRRRKPSSRRRAGSNY